MMPRPIAIKGMNNENILFILICKIPVSFGVIIMGTTVMKMVKRM